MRILALDFSWRNTGWCVVEDGKPIDYGNIKTKPRKKKNKKDKDKLKDILHESENYEYIKNSIKGLVIRNDLNIDGFADFDGLNKKVKIIAEVPFFSQSSDSAILIGMGWALMKQLNVEIITGKEVKKILTGNPNASKVEVAKVVKNRGGLELMFKNDHIIDAFSAYLAWSSQEYKFKKLTS